jgi:hypothetical protein
MKDGIVIGMAIGAVLISALVVTLVLGNQNRLEERLWAHGHRIESVERRTEQNLEFLSQQATILEGLVIN